MQRTIYLFLLILPILISLHALSLKAQTIPAYIEENADQAQYIMQNYGIPASIVLAIAIHESAAGTSKIAKHLNNHFGIKGPNTNKVIKSSYRDYPSVDSSFNHFADILKNRKHYNGLFDKYSPFDFKNWIYGIQRAGYAGSKLWASKVLAIIRKYKLNTYDHLPEASQH
ncbi:MAG: hemagglutinin [Pedobacter sp.]|nr:MAG: hemagglutinin [Pedobacter sp.]